MESGFLSSEQEAEIIDVMIVDDAPIIRKLYARMLSNNQHVNIVAVAENGLEALIRQREQNVDVVVLDIEMPIMDGLQALERLLQYDPEVMVVIASTLNWENAEITHIALNNGAADYLEKPSSVRSNLTATEFEDYMNEKILTLGFERRKRKQDSEQYDHAVIRKRRQLHDHVQEQRKKAEKEKQAFVRTVDVSGESVVEKPKIPIRKKKEDTNTVLDEAESLESKAKLSGFRRTLHAPPSRQVLKKPAATAPKQAPAPPSPSPVIKQKPSSIAGATARHKLQPAVSRLLNHRQQQIFENARRNVSSQMSDEKYRAIPKNFKPKAIAVGASTGGPPLVQKLIPELAQFNLPIFLTQHMPEFFTSVLATQISHFGNIHVVEVRQEEIIANNGIYIAHGGSHLGVKTKEGQPIAFQDDSTPSAHCCKPSVDVMVAQMIDVYGGDVLLIVLTGMGRDGSHYAGKLADRGGVVVVQDEASSLIWGMPGAIVKNGDATVALPPDQIIAWCRKYIDS